MVTGCEDDRRTGQMKGGQLDLKVREELGKS